MTNKLNHVPERKKKKKLATAAALYRAGENAAKRRFGELRVDIDSECKR